MGVVDSANVLYLNISCGFLVNKKKEISARAYEGIFKSIAREVDSYEGKDLSKIKLHMADNKSKEEAVISFTAESWYAIGFFQRISNIDLSKPFTIGVSQSDKNEKISFCWMKQSGNKIEKDELFPVPEKVSVGKTVVLNWEPVNEMVDKIMERLNSIFPEGNPAASPEEEEPFDVTDDYKQRMGGNGVQVKMSGMPMPIEDDMEKLPF
jgi:hypothetical protein